MKSQRLAARLSLLLFLGAGCGAIDSIADCVSVCSRYRDCFRNEYDVPACAERCRAHANDDPTFRRQVDTCHTCIYDRSCTESQFSCSASCTSLVP